MQKSGNNIFQLQFNEEQLDYLVSSSEKISDLRLSKIEALFYLIKEVVKSLSNDTDPAVNNETNDDSLVFEGNLNQLISYWNWPRTSGWRFLQELEQIGLISKSCSNKKNKIKLPSLGVCRSFINSSADNVRVAATSQLSLANQNRGEIGEGMFAVKEIYSELAEKLFKAAFEPLASMIQEIYHKVAEDNPEAFKSLLLGERTSVPDEDTLDVLEYISKDMTDDFCGAIKELLCTLKKRGEKKQTFVSNPK